MFKLISTCIFLITTICNPILGQINTDRPSQSESSSTIQKGALQLENGIQLSQSKYLGTTTNQLILPNCLVRFGLTDGIELRLIGQYETIKTNNTTFQGISDLNFGSKIQLLQNDNKNTEVSFLTSLTIPSGSAAVSANKYQSTNKISVTHSLNQISAFTYNLGYILTDKSSGALIYSALYSRSFGNKTSVFFEGFGTLSSSFSINCDAGISYLLKNWIQLDAAIASGINQEMNYVTIGCSFLL